MLHKVNLSNTVENGVCPLRYIGIKKCKIVIYRLRGFYFEKVEMGCFFEVMFIIDRDPNISVL